MGSQDIGLKSYLEDTRRYADLWNGGVFEGRQMIRPEELEEITPVLPKADKKVVLEKTRDLVMMQSRKGQRLAVFALENQTEVDYGMPVRIMLQEALEYDRQIRKIMHENEKKNREYQEGKGSKVYHDDGEYLYKIRKEDKLYPVATLIVYWGEEMWKGARSLHEMIHFNALGQPEELELKRLVPEYPLHFLDLAEFHHFEYFKTELRPLFELYQRRNSQKNFMNYIKTDGMCQSMDEESWYMLSQMTHSKDLSKLIEEKKQRKGKGKAMCKAIEDLKNEGRAEGRAESIIDLLEDCGTVSDDLKRRIMEENNFKVLKSWLKLAVRVKNVEEFVSYIN